MAVFKRRRTGSKGKALSSGKWTVQFTDASGIVRRLPGFTDKSATLELERGIPPPMTLAGRKVWIAGKIRAWLVATAERREAAALKDARRLRVFTI